MVFWFQLVASKATKSGDKASKATSKKKEK